MQKFNKTTVSVIIGALLTGAASIWPTLLSADLVAAIQTVLVTVAVYFIPNKEN